MSAREALQAGVCAALRGVGGLTVFDAPPVRAALPFAVVEEPLLADWGTLDMDGREGRVAITLRDEGERPVRLRGLVGAAEDAVAGMPAALGGGWRVIGLMLVRSRIVRERDGRWAATSEFRMRMLRMDS